MSDQTKTTTGTGYRPAEDIARDLMPKRTEDRPPHPLVMDRETKLFRYATHADIRRWEHMELRYNNLLATLRDAVNVEQI